MEGIEDKDKEYKKRKAKIPLHKYVGETCRSLYERAREHMNDLQQLKPESHMLKHVVDKHEGMDIEKVKFGVRSAFERQLLESVIIQQERESHSLLNSRAEYNRCAVPRLSTKIGDNNYKKFEKEMEKDKEKNSYLESKIRDLRKSRNIERRNIPRRKDEPALKRRKMETGHKEIKESVQIRNVCESEKRKQEEIELPPNKRMKPLEVQSRIELLSKVPGRVPVSPQTTTSSSPSSGWVPVSPLAGRNLVGDNDEDEPPKYPDDMMNNKGEKVIFIEWEDKIKRVQRES